MSRCQVSGRAAQGRRSEPNRQRDLGQGPLGTLCRPAAGRQGSSAKAKACCAARSKGLPMPARCPAPCAPGRQHGDRRHQGFREEVDAGRRRLPRRPGHQAQPDARFLASGGHQMPNGIKVETPTQTEILIKGSSGQVVGQVAAECARSAPEPYKGKGVRYSTRSWHPKETEEIRAIQARNHGQETSSLRGRVKPAPRLRSSRWCA